MTQLDETPYCTCECVHGYTCLDRCPYCYPPEHEHADPRVLALAEGADERRQQAATPDDLDVLRGRGDAVMPCRRCGSVGPGLQDCYCAQTPALTPMSEYPMPWLDRRVYNAVGRGLKWLGTRAQAR